MPVWRAISSLRSQERSKAARQIVTTRFFYFSQNQVVGAADPVHQGVDPNTGSHGLASAGTVGSCASSSYHSLQASVQKANTHGFVFQLSYTYAHALDNGSSFENSGFGSNGARGYNQFNQALNYGDSQFDVRHRLVFAPLYKIPNFAGSGHSFKNMLLAGWEVSGIVSVATGFPYDISYAGATSLSLWCSADFNFYACPDVPNQTGPATFGNPRIRQASGNSCILPTLRPTRRASSPAHPHLWTKSLDLSAMSTAIRITVPESTTRT